MYLHIDTATRFGAIGLWSPSDRSLFRVISWRSRHNHTAELLPAVQEALRAAGAAPAGLQGIGVIHGPGGFSALRAGLGAAKGVAFSLSIPIVGVSALEASAYPYRGTGWPVCAIIETGRDAVGWALFQQTGEGWKRRSPDRVSPISQLLSRTGRHVLFCGEGTAAYADRLRAAMGSRAHIALEPMPLSRLQGLVELASARLDEGDVDSLAGLEPHYLRPPGITRPNAPRRVLAGAEARANG